MPPGQRCCIIGCKATSHKRDGTKLENGLRFFVIPKLGPTAFRGSESNQMREITTRRRLAWISAIRRPDVTFDRATHSLRVCSQHFHKDRLRQRIVETPSQPILNEPKIKKTSTERFSSYYKKMRLDEAKYAEYLQEKRHASKEAYKNNKLNDDEEEKKRKKELNRLRVQRCRLKKKENCATVMTQDKKTTAKPLYREGSPSYVMMETDPDWVPSLNLGHVEMTATNAEQHARCQCRPFKVQVQAEQISSTNQDLEIESDTPKRIRPRYTKEPLAEATGRVRSEHKPINPVARHYGIPSHILRQEVEQPVKGQRFVFTRHEKVQMAKYLSESLKDGEWYTQTDVRDMVKKFCEDRGKRTCFPKNRPGKSWMRSFLRRLPGIACKVVNEKRSDISPTTRKQLVRWFNLAKRRLTKQHPSLLQTPDRIFTASEFVFRICPETETVQEICDPRHEVFMRDTKSDFVSVWGCVSASGLSFPPVCVFWNNMDSSLQESQIEQVMLDFVEKNILPAIGRKKPMLFFTPKSSNHYHGKPIKVLAGTNKRVILHTLEFKENYLIQPMYQEWFERFKSVWKDEAFRITGSNRVKMDQFSTVLEAAWGIASAPEIILNSFRQAGIFPFNPTEPFNSDKFQLPLVESITKNHNSNSTGDILNDTEAGVQDFDIKIENPETESLDIEMPNSVNCSGTASHYIAPDIDNIKTEMPDSLEMSNLDTHSRHSSDSVDSDLNNIKEESLELADSLFLGVSTSTHDQASSNSLNHDQSSPKTSTNTNLLSDNQTPKIDINIEHPEGFEMEMANMDSDCGPSSQSLQTAVNTQEKSLLAVYHFHLNPSTHQKADFSVNCDQSLPNTSTNHNLPQNGAPMDISTQSL